MNIKFESKYGWPLRNGGAVRNAVFTVDGVEMDKEEMKEFVTNNNLSPDTPVETPVKTRTLAWFQTPGSLLA